MTVTRESLNDLKSHHSNPDLHLDWDLIFTLPEWLKVWWQNFGSEAELFILAVRKKGEIIGLAPLQIRNGKASFIGSVDVCDYQDCIVSPGKEIDFFKAVIDYLLQNGIGQMHLETIRPDSATATYLKPLAEERKYQIEYRRSDISLDIDLPLTWEEYLNSLERKQRHELRRKLRNILDLGDINYQTIEKKNEIPQAVDTFLKLFPESRQDKAQFMTPEMQVFFRSLATSLTEIGILKFGVLTTAGKPIAMIMYFDYNKDHYKFV